MGSTNPSCQLLDGRQGEEVCGQELPTGYVDGHTCLLRATCGPRSSLPALTRATTPPPLARIHLLVRANDHLYEASFKLYTSRLEDKIWTHTLTQVAGHFGATDPVVVSTAILIDKKRQWNQVSNIWKNSAIRTLLRQDRKF